MRGGGARLAFASRLLLLALAAACTAGRAGGHGVQPLSRVAIHRARVALDASAAVRASPSLLGSRVRWVEFPLFSLLLLPFTSTTTLAASIRLRLLKLQHVIFLFFPEGQHVIFLEVALRGQRDG